MKETPNLSYIKSLSGGDLDFEKKILSVIKKELPLEKKDYYKNLKDKKYKEAAENVHKFKHKISIFGLEKSYYIAVDHENSLKEGNTSLKDDFDAILDTITEFLNLL